jgi:hypothetical protein
MNSTNKIKLKPVVFVQGKYGYNANNTSQQIMLLKALKVTQDPNKLKNLIGVKTVADVYRTLDKLAMRKEYHAALARKGISFDYLVEKIKNEIEGADKSSDRLAGIKMLMQSVGMDKYEDIEGSNQSWEDALLQLTQKKEKEGETIDIDEYEVVVPETPAHIKKKKQEQIEESRKIYE